MAQESFMDTFSRINFLFFQTPHLVSTVESNELLFSKLGHHILTIDGLWTGQEARCFFKKEDFDKFGVYHICLKAEKLIDRIWSEIHILSSSFEAEDFDKNKLFPI